MMAWRSEVGATVAVAVLLAASGAQAQQLAGTFSQLQVLVKPGDKVTVTDAAGSVIKGRIETLTSDSLALLVNGHRRELSEHDISSIRQRRSDSLKDGALWGFGVGAGMGLLAGLEIASECSRCTGFAFAMAAIYGGIGSGIGVGVDAMMEGPQVIFARAEPRAARFTLAPLLARHRSGLAMSWRFPKR